MTTDLREDGNKSPDQLRADAAKLEIDAKLKDKEVAEKAKEQAKQKKGAGSSKKAESSDAADDDAEVEEEEEAAPQCEAQTAAGTQCKLSALESSSKCAIHNK